MSKPLSRPKRWAAACSDLRPLIDALRDAEVELEEATEKFDEGETAADPEFAALTAARNKAQEKLYAAGAAVEDGMSVLEELRGEYEEWKDGLPDNLQTSNTADLLETIVALDFNWTSDDDADDAESVLDEADSVDLPRGFGRD